jgi:hypothetical protein
MSNDKLEVGSIYRVGQSGDLMKFLGGCGVSKVVYFKDLKGDSGFHKTEFRNYKEAVGFYFPKFQDIPCKKVFKIIK